MIVEVGESQPSFSKGTALVLVLVFLYSELGEWLNGEDIYSQFSSYFWY